MNPLAFRNLFRDKVRLTLAHARRNRLCGSSDHGSDRARLALTKNLVQPSSAILCRAGRRLPCLWCDQGAKRRARMGGGERLAVWRSP